MNAMETLCTVFTLVNAFLFKNLPFADSDRVLYISSRNRSTGHGRGESYPDCLYFQSEVKPFQALGAFTRSDVDVSGSSGLPTQYKGAHLNLQCLFIDRPEAHRRPRLPPRGRAAERTSDCNCVPQPLGGPLRPVHRHG